MDERNDDMDKVDEVMWPGFRFHPTDEELVGFYLRRKIQQKPLSIELIRQLDIYKYDPWDLPKLATTGEKEWYFYCPRDRKYRNSVRPNRVTGAGFWKATGTDRPIYSSEGTRCIGLKKSLVFYKGRAARGVKTDWMMHEFRLPSSSPAGPSPPPKTRPIGKNTPAVNDAWAICRIFKKTTNSMAQRALSHSWVSPLPPETTTTVSDVFSVSHTTNCCPQLSSYDISCKTEAPQFSTANHHYQLHHHHQAAAANYYPPLELDAATPCKTFDLTSCEPFALPISYAGLPTGLITFAPAEISVPSKFTADVASLMLLNMYPSLLGDVLESRTSAASMDFGWQEQHRHCTDGFTMDLPSLETTNGDLGGREGDIPGRRKNKNAATTGSPAGGDRWGTERAVTSTTLLPFGGSLPTNLSDDAWKYSCLPWDSHPCPPSEMSASYSTCNKCYT